MPDRLRGLSFLLALLIVGLADAPAALAASSAARRAKVQPGMSEKAVLSILGVDPVDKSRAFASCSRGEVWNFAFEDRAMQSVCFEKARVVWRQDAEPPDSVPVFMDFQVQIPKLEEESCEAGDGVVTLKVIDDNGSAIPGAFVGVINVNARSFEALDTDRDGSAQLRSHSSGMHAAVVYLMGFRPEIRIRELNERCGGLLIVTLKVAESY